MKKSIFSLILSLVYAFLFYYGFSPALNIHSGGFWLLIISTLLFFIFLTGIASLTPQGPRKKKAAAVVASNQSSIPVKIALMLLLAVFVFLFLGTLIGSKLFRSSTYASIAEGRIEDRDFLEDVKEEAEISNIALMDTSSAMIIGNRQMGSLSSLVSQFETSDYSTVTVNDQPLKISALAYVNLFRYFNNKDSGIPGYIQVNPVTQKAQFVELTDKLKYVPSAYFGHDLKRHIHSQYPSAIVDSFYFELDESQKPYYVSPYYVYKAGLFGAKDVGGVIIVDPATGDMEKYVVGDIPEWVDRVYDGDLLVKQYDWYGTLKNGYWNSIFSKVGCVVTTEDYGFKSLNNDIWVFTGVTSVASDESNIGFVLMNSRTGTINYYDIYGAEEYSAMSAAEGQVQHLRYTASFPSVINVDNQPVYIMVLKDSGGLTKMYAIVNLRDYSQVATGESQQEALINYKNKLGIVQDDSSSLDSTATVTVEEIKYASLDGNTFAYVISGGKAYKLSVKDNEKIVLIKAGDTIELLCEDNSSDIVNARLK